jgi:hypothetical protein
MECKGPQNAGVSEGDRDVFDDQVLEDVHEHIRKLLGLVPYSMAEVKPCVSVQHFRRLMTIIYRIRRSKGYQRYQVLAKENADLAVDLENIRREMRRWGMAIPRGKYEKHEELPPGLDAPA